MRPRAVWLTLCAAGAAIAAAPPPARPVAASLYSGRWFDIAHTPNSRQRNCHAPTSDFTAAAGASFAIAQTCHKGSPSGPPEVFRAKGRITPGSANAKFRIAFLGGLISQDYWILDHASDGRWAIMATPGGHYVWLLSRTAALDEATRAAALRRIATLGYDVGRLEAR